MFILASGESSTFSLAIYEELPNIDSVVATIVGNSVVEFDRAQVDISNTLLTFDDNDILHITGELMNNNDYPVEISGLVAATFDAEGLVVTTDTYNVTIRYLEPGDSGPFRVSIPGPLSGSDIIEDFEVYMDVERAEEEIATQLLISDA